MTTLTREQSGDRVAVPSAPAPTPWRWSTPRHPVAAIVALGLVSLAGTAWFAWSLPATASRRARPSTPLADGIGPWRWLYEHAAPPTSPGALAATIVAVTVALFGAWVAVIAVAWRRSSPGAVRAVLGLVAAAALLGVLALPNQTSDIYDYVLFGRVGAVHGGEPYRDVPDAFPDDPTYPYSSHQYTGRPDNKLPVWTVVAVAAAEVAGDDPLTNLLVFRGLLAGCWVGTTALVAWVLGRVRPSAAAAGAATFGLSPVVLVYGTSKTDSLMVLLMVLSIALVVAGRTRLAPAAAAGAVLVKLIAAPVLALVVLLPPLTGPGEERRPRPDGRAILARAAVALIVAAAFYAPFPDPLGLARGHLVESRGSSAAAPFYPAALAAFVLLVAALAWRSWRAAPATDADRTRLLISSAALVLVVFAILLTRPGLPWYLLTPLAAVALARSVPLLVIVGTVSFSSFLMGWWASIDTRDHPLPELDVSRPLLSVGVAAAALAVLVTGSWRRHRDAVTVPRPGVNGPAPLDGCSGGDGVRRVGPHTPAHEEAGR